MKSKRKISIVVLLLVIVMTLTACGKFTCDLCGKEKSGKKYKTEVLGQSVTICKDCHDDLQSLGNLFK